MNQEPRKSIAVPQDRHIISYSSLRRLGLNDQPSAILLGIDRGPGSARASISRDTKIRKCYRAKNLDGRNPTGNRCMCQVFQTTFSDSHPQDPKRYGATVFRHGHLNIFGLGSLPLGSASTFTTKFASNHFLGSDLCPGTLSFQPCFSQS